ncbi:DUF6483 family protein [Weeksellaceae bacterium A-14]|uniref:DUF6483 family protein n=1 Tax=Daejeonia sp. YH14 TaxID=3439042 RepID=UPI0031E4ACE4
MIHDKDYMIRMVREFSNFLSKLLLGKNEGNPEENQMAFETQMKDIFHMNYEELAAKTKEEINDIILEKEDHHQADYYDLLGNLFYYKFKEKPDADLAAKAKMFYELWLQKSSTFSLPVMGRISELQSAL